MAGALSYGIRRRRFEAGGSATSRGYDDPAPDSFTPPDEPTPAYDYQPAPAMYRPPQGALSSGATQIPDTPEAKVAASQQALANLGGQQAQAIMRGRYTDPSLMEGSTNLPLLAAAGAMLKPTHSGGFSEALGNAFSAAVPVAEQERKRRTDAQLRDQLYGINQQRANTYGQRADIYADRVAVQNAVQTRMAELKGNGQDDLANHRQATLELQQGKLDAYIQRTGVQERQGERRLDQGDRRADQTDQKIAQAADRMRDSQEWRSASARLGAQRIDEARMNNILSRAAYLKANSPGYNGQGGFDKAVNEVLQADQKQLGRGAPQSGAQAAARQPVGGAPGGLPMPGSAAEAVVGQVYNTARGPARWDGQQFIPVGR